MILVLIDAHLKWIEVMVTPTSTSTVVIEELRDKFSQFGIPETIITDNGTCFMSAEFELFLEKNGVKHLTTAPYHHCLKWACREGCPDRKERNQKV